MFTRNSFQFLTELNQHNDRDWFKANQPRYEAQVRTPALQFIEAMQGPILSLSPRFNAVPKKVGGSLMRPKEIVVLVKIKHLIKLILGFNLNISRLKMSILLGFMCI